MKKTTTNSVLIKNLDANVGACVFGYVLILARNVLNTFFAKIRLSALRTSHGNIDKFNTLSVLGVEVARVLH